MYKSVTFRYSTSLEKWRGIRRFVDANGLDVEYVDAMIEKIISVGDADLSDAVDADLGVKSEYDVTIDSAAGYFDIMYSDDEFPCPHCAKYNECKDCPLWGGNRTCCEEWSAAKYSALLEMRKSDVMRSAGV